MANALEYIKGASKEEIEKLNRQIWGQRIDDWARNFLGKESYYGEQQRLENERYWNDYEKNTGVEAKYPILAGQNINRATEHMPGAINSIPMNQLYGGQASTQIKGGMYTAEGMFIPRYRV